jgi:hypothetical protein
MSRLYLFNVDRKYGFLDERGKIRVRATYDGTGPAGGNQYYGRKGNEWIYLDARGKKLFSRQSPYVVEFGPDDIGASLRYVAEPEPWCRGALVWPDGRQVAIDADDVWPPSEGLAAARVSRRASLPETSWWNDPGTGWFGYVDLKGKWIIEPGLAGAGPFDGGLAPAAMRSKGKARWGAIDKTGAWRCKPTHARSLSAGEGMIAVSDAKDRWGLADTNDVVVKPRFVMPPMFRDGVAAARLPTGAGVIDTTGAWVIEPSFADARDPIAGVIAVATHGRTQQPKWGLVARDGRVVVKPTYASLIRTGDLWMWTGPYRRTTTYEWGYLSPAGEIIWSGLR